MSRLRPTKVTADPSLTRSSSPSGRTVTSSTFYRAELEREPGEHDKAFASSCARCDSSLVGEHARTCRLRRQRRSRLSQPGRKMRRLGGTRPPMRKSPIDEVHSRASSDWRRKRREQRCCNPLLNGPDPPIEEAAASLGPLLAISCRRTPEVSFVVDESEVGSPTNRGQSAGPARLEPLIRAKFSWRCGGPSPRIETLNARG